MAPLPVGKLKMDYLADLLRHYATTEDPRVLVGPGIGEDATVIDFGERLLVCKTDPITFATEAIGWYAVHVNANDVAVMGAAPRWFLASLLLPEGLTDEGLVEDIFAQIVAACQEVGATLCGGHTEITYGLDRPIVVGQMLGEVEQERLVTSAGAQVGDAVLLTKGAGIEATSIIAREMADRLQEKFPPQFLRRCQDFLYDPGISVVRDARIAVQTARIHAMHDPTEGGVATALWELARAAGVGLRIDYGAIPVPEETRLLCAEFGLDPLGVIGSGALLITLAPADAKRVLAALGEAGIPAACIGQVVPAEEGVLLQRDGQTQPLPIFHQDEITRLF